MGFEWKAFGTKILGDFKSEIGAAWNDYTPDERALVERCAMRAAFITAAGLEGEVDVVEKQKVDQQLSSISSAAAGSLAKAFWNVVANLLGAVASVLLK